MERSSDRNMPDRQTLQRLLRELDTNGLFYASRRDTCTVRYSRIPAVEEEVLRTVEDSPSITQRAVGCEPFLCVEPYMKCMSASFTLVVRCILLEVFAGNGDSSQLIDFVIRQLNSAFCCFNVAFPLPYSCAKYDYLGSSGIYISDI